MDRFFRSKGFFGKIPSVSFSVFLFLFSSIINGQTVPEEVFTLELNKPLTREIAGGQKHNYQIDLAADQFVSMTVEQLGIDVLVRLYGIDGKPLADYDAEMRPTEAEKIEFVAKLAGVYRFELEPRYKLLPPGKYELRVSELHPASGSEKSLQEARASYSESVRLFNAGKYPEAKQLIEQAIEIRQKELGAENAQTASAQTHLARILDSLGRYDEAQKLNQEILSVREKILGADHPDLGYTFNYLALNAAHKEDFQSALAFHQRALAVREKVFGANHPVVASSLINLGVVFDALGDKLKAGELYRRALSIQERSVGAETLNTAVVLNNIGKIYNDLDEFKQAEPFLLRAVAILEKLFAPDNPRIFDALSNLALCFIGQGELVKAESLYQRILESREQTLGAEHPLTAHVVYNLASLYVLNGDLEKSEAFYRRALAITETTFGLENPRVSKILDGLAPLLARKGDIAEAIKIQQRANIIDEQTMILNLAIGSERQKIAYITSLFEQTNQNISLQTHFAPENQEAIDLAATTVLRQKGRVLDAVANDLVELRQRSGQKERALIDNLNEVTGELAELILGGGEDEDGEMPLEEYQAKIKALTNKREKLEDEISRSAAGFYQKSDSVGLAPVRALIPADSALLEFAVYLPLTFDEIKNKSEPRYVVYVLRKNGGIKWKDLGTVKEIDAAIDSLREALGDPKRKDIQALARSVDEKVMAPLRPLLGDDVAHLLISPDGNLNLIPFEAMSDEKGRYLIENYAVTYLTSGRDLLRMQAPRKNAEKPLLIANPAFGEPLYAETAKLETKRKTAPLKRKRGSITAARDLSETYFAPLGGTLQEARSIQTLFPEASLLTGTQATEALLKQTSAPRLLHIATHGFFLEDRLELSKDANSRIENPLLRSGLALTGANRRSGGGGSGGDQEDGILTALEASGLNLWGTKLVVLSACDTGLGEVRNGEGVYGLRRAFTLAGTQSLVMSLWSVSDYITRDLMTNYYKHLKQGAGRGESLRRVQLEMLKREDRRHPFYWASFIQSGEWANLDGKR